ncbi:MAG: ester cyclase [Rhodoblastus sp.]|nr:MAG: ester cyclase [Rhodoblastus sp.]
MPNRRAMLAGLVAGAATSGVVKPALAAASDKAIVEAFYSGFLTSKGQDVAVEGARLMATNFESVGDFSGKAKGREDLIAQIKRFHTLVPNLKWEPVEILEAGGRYVVRSRATGAPNGPLFGVNGEGKSFTMMTIDIHEVVDGKLLRAYHVEDWAGALRQLAAQ